jgi:hypothetical protein
MICAEINFPYDKSFLVSTWYKPPNANINVFEDYTKFVEKYDYANILSS